MQNTTKKECRIEYMDMLRVIAMLAVIFNHSFGYFSVDEYFKYQNTSIFYLDNLLNSITRFNVPIFLMLSGALILNNSKNMSLSYLFKKRIPGVFIPFMIWNIIYISVYCIIKGDISFGREIVASLFLVRGYAGHLWYIYALIAIYLITPMLIGFISNTSEKILDYTILLWILFSVIFPFLHEFIPQITFEKFFDLNILSGYLGYYLLGYKLSKIKKEYKDSLLICIFVFGWLMTTLGGIIYQNYIGEKSMFFQTFLTPNVVMMSVSLFIFVKQKISKNGIPNKFKKVVLELSYYSFGIYLVHFLFRTIVIMVFEKVNFNNYIYLIISPIATFTMSYLTIFIASKFKILSFGLTGNKFRKIS